MAITPLGIVAARAVARTAARRAVTKQLGSSSLVSKLLKTVLGFAITAATKKL